MKPNVRIPDFVVIGAVKAATTWTADQLRAHPDIFIPGPEPHFFSREYDRGVAWYNEWFAEARADQTIGEKSADYLAHPLAAQRLAEHMPNARLVVQLRNPVERAFSDYCMLYRRGTITDRPLTYFSSPDDVTRRFLEGGLYAEHLRRFFYHFSEDQILIVLMEDIEARPLATLERIQAHIGVRHFIPEGSCDSRSNDSTVPVLPIAMRKSLKPFKGLVEPLRGNRVFEAVRGVFARRIEYPHLCEASRKLLHEFYADDLRDLQRLLGREISEWSCDASQSSGAPADFSHTVIA